MPTQSKRYWTEGKVIQTPNGPLNIGGGTFVTDTSPTPTPTPTSTPTPTPTPALVTPVPQRTPGRLESAQTDLANASAARASAQAQADAYAAQQRQARIDAINTTFAPRIEREKIEGDQRLSRVAALNFKSGVVGSGVDTTKTAEQKGLNERAVQSLEDAKATAIQEAFGWADELARQRAEDIYTAGKEGAQANVDKYKQQAETALNALKVFGQQNFTVDQLKSVDSNTYATLRDVSGMSDGQIDTYLKVNAPEGTYQWSQAQINGSQMVVPGIDPKTKLPTLTKLDLGFEPKSEVQSVVKTDAGIVLINKDKTWDVLPGTGSVPEVNLTGEQLKQRINKQIATPDFQALTDNEKQSYIRAQGGDPGDFGF